MLLVVQLQMQKFGSLEGGGIGFLFSFAKNCNARFNIRDLTEIKLLIYLSFAEEIVTDLQTASNVSATETPDGGSMYNMSLLPPVTVFSEIYSDVYKIKLWTMSNSKCKWSGCSREECVWWEGHGLHRIHTSSCSVQLWDLLPFLKFFWEFMALCSPFPELEEIYQI